LGYLAGFKSYLAGVQSLLRNSKLRKTAILPLIMDFLIFGVVVYLVCIQYLPVLVSGLLVNAGTGFWATALAAATQSLAFVFGLVASGVITFALGTWLASPFNALLAEKALVHFGGKQEAPFNTQKWLRTTLKMALVGMIRSAILLIFGVLLFVLSFIPVLHLPILFVGFFIMSTDCLDYSLETLEYDLKGRFRYYFQNFPQISGFATALGLTFMVPGLSFFLMPAAIAGAAHLVSENKKQ
jgi:uncharacterized protein involved in cysteine biosynthesis